MSAQVVGHQDDDVEGVAMRPPRSEAKGGRWSVLTCAVVGIFLTAQLAALFQLRSHVNALHIRFGLASEGPGRAGSEFRVDYKGSNEGKAAAELTHLRKEIQFKDKQLKASSDSALQAQVRNLKDELQRLRESDPQLPKAPPYLEFPQGTVEVMINIGPNVSPIIFCKDTGSKVCILLELASSPSTYLKELYKERTHTMVFNLGIAPYHGLVSFPLLNGDGLSTSLNKPAYSGGWDVVHGRDFSGVLTLADVLDSIDPKFEIELIATDMQGYDFQAIKSAGDRLHRVRAVVCETYKDGHATYAGVTNAIDADWSPYMAALGFSLKGCSDGFKDEVAWELDCKFTNDKFK